MFLTYPQFVKLFSFSEINGKVILQYAQVSYPLSFGKNCEFPFIFIWTDRIAWRLFILVAVGAIQNIPTDTNEKCRRIKYGYAQLVMKSVSYLINYSQESVALHMPAKRSTMSYNNIMLWSISHEPSSFTIKTAIKTECARE